MSSFDAATFSQRRGYIYFPTLQTDREISGYTREEIMRKSRWLVRNVGYARRCIHGVANMVGHLSPVAITRDKAWNKAAEELFERTYGSSPTVFDVQGRNNFYGYQTVALIAQMTDGDFFSALTSSQQGRAMVLGYEGHQIRDGIGTLPEGLKLRDGVICDKWGKALGFRSVTGGYGEPQVEVDLPARDVMHLADFASIGHTRGVSALAHAITHFLDATEIKGLMKLGTKIAAQQGIYISGTEPQPRSKAPLGVTVASGSATQATADQWSMKDLYENTDERGGKVLQLQPGQEVKTLLDQRPHPNSVALLEVLNRDIAVGIGFSPDILFDISKLGGATARYAIAAAQQSIERIQQRLVDQMLTRFWVYFCAKEMAAGRLAPCGDEQWYLVGWQPQEKLTVDVGREGRLSIDLHKAGMLTLSTWYGRLGQDWARQIDQSIEEFAYKTKACADAEKLYGFPINPALVWPDSAAQPDPMMPPFAQDNAQQLTADQIAQLANAA